MEQPAENRNDYPITVPAWVMGALGREMEKNGQENVQWLFDAAEKVRKEWNG